YPLIKPGTFVQIDPEIKKVTSQTGLGEYDRPIYFLDLRSEYGCGWCEMLGDKLFLLSHAQSPFKIRSFAYPEEVEVLGQVIGVAMRIVVSRDELAAKNSESSEQS